MTGNIKAIAAAIMLATITGACGDKADKTPDNANALRLYADLRDIYISYADSLTATTDSAAADSLAMRLDDRIRRTYLAYPAGLDMHISESQNDTLWTYASRIAAIRNRLRRHLPTDTIAADTTHTGTVTADTTLRHTQLPHTQPLP